MHLVVKPGLGLDFRGQTVEKTVQIVLKTVKTTRGTESTSACSIVSTITAFKPTQGRRTTPKAIRLAQERNRWFQFPLVLDFGEYDRTVYTPILSSSPDKTVAQSNQRCSSN